jgi:mono/diheme cytochrome c family protein
VDAATLNEGREVYVRICAACHGDEGDGRGPVAPSLAIPPRDFRPALFKYAGVPAGELPNDADLLRTLRRGLEGTPMLAWDLTDRERRVVIHYLKTFSPHWRRRTPPPRILPTPDPWRGRTPEAVLRGAAIYHVRAQCSTCHGAYATRSELQDMSRALTGRGIDRFPPDLYERRPRESDFLAGDEPVRIVPPDFLEDRMKNGTSLEELYRTIAAGIGGTAMPQWQGSLPEEDLWALVHYTKSLVDRRGRH